MAFEFENKWDPVPLPVLENLLTHSNVASADA